MEQSNAGEYFADIATVLAYVEAQWELFPPRSNEFADWGEVSTKLHKSLMEAREKITDDNDKRPAFKRADLSIGAVSPNIVVSHEQALALLESLSRVMAYWGKMRSAHAPFTEEWLKMEKAHRKLHKVKD